MRDILPDEVELRDAAVREIVAVYRAYGFRRIETPALESLRLLAGSDGGENEKLIFKVMKRGEELEAARRAGEDLADLGLRFDLTVPLARYYAENHARLPDPLKAIQIGPVWRAERPQKGRFRQFTQCDIDVLGLASPLVEIELILATTDALTRLGLAGRPARGRVRRGRRPALRGVAAGPERGRALVGRAEGGAAGRGRGCVGVARHDHRHRERRDRRGLPGALRSDARAWHGLLHGPDLRDRGRRLPVFHRRRRAIRPDDRPAARPRGAGLRLLDRFRASDLDPGRARGDARARGRRGAAAAAGAPGGRRRRRGRGRPRGQGLESRGLSRILGGQAKEREEAARRPRDPRLLGVRHPRRRDAPADAESAGAAGRAPAPPGGAP